MIEPKLTGSVFRQYTLNVWPVLSLQTTKTSNCDKFVGQCLEHASVLKSVSQRFVLKLSARQL